MIKNFFALVLVILILVLLIPCKLMELFAYTLDHYLKKTFVYKKTVDVISLIIDFRFNF